MSNYFAKRRERASDSLQTAMLVEAAVAEDLRKIADLETLSAHQGEAILSALRLSLLDNQESRTWYKHSRRSRLLERAEALFTQDPAEILAKHHLQPTPPGGLDLTTGQYRVPLANGHTIISGWIDTCDPDALPAGDYLSVEDAKGREIFYLDAADWFAEPASARRRLYRFLQCCLGADAGPTEEVDFND